MFWGALKHGNMVENDSQKQQILEEEQPEGKEGWVPLWICLF